MRTLRTILSLVLITLAGVCLGVYTASFWAGAVFVLSGWALVCQPDAKGGE